AVIWATGYRDNSDWVAIREVKDARENFVHREGTAPIPRFYFIGRPWQRSRGSALLMGVGDDAALIKDHIAAELGAQSTGGGCPASDVGPCTGDHAQLKIEQEHIGQQRDL
ncbi:MAG: hypothetical protein M3380_06600, partial [Chloroflexota bacterium]|nr:hypothetical protein [Chloroflexota bacterium]